MKNLTQEYEKVLNLSGFLIKQMLAQSNNPYYQSMAPHSSEIVRIIVPIALAMASIPILVIAYFVFESMRFRANLFWRRLRNSEEENAFKSAKDTIKNMSCVYNFYNKKRVSQ